MADRSDPSRADRRRAGLLLALMGGCYLAFAGFFVPRLTNVHFGDVEFTGWSGPLGERLLRGERPYVDFVLPIPPGSFLVLAAVQKLMGRALLQQELWVNATAQLLMALTAYAIAVRLTTRANAVLVALSTLIALFWLHKECAYDHTAQLVVWLSFAAGVRALLDAPGPGRDRYWIGAGFFAALTLLFKQSTGTGALVGWGMAFVYLTVVGRAAPGRGPLFHGDVRRFAIGAGLGLAVLWLTLALLGSTLGAYFSAVFLDGPKLKGGSWLLIKHVIGYVTTEDAWMSSIVFTVGLTLLGARLIKQRGKLELGDEPLRRDPASLGRVQTALVAAVMVTTFALAVALIVRSKALDPDLLVVIDRLRTIPHFGLVLGCAFFVGHLQLGDTSSNDDARAAGHAINALLIAVLATTLLHNTSAPELRVFYDNNPIIPFAFLFVYVALERAALDKLKFVVIVCVVATLFGSRLDRALVAKISVGRTGHWAGMKVNERGRDIVFAARRVQSLTAPEDTVLVLPEDVQLAALIGRPRPPIRGAIVFVDQYAEHLAARDIQTLASHPPKVIVLHPPEMHLWAQLFRIWSGDSGAQKVLEFTQRELLPKRYRLESTTNTRWLWRDATLQIWVRAD
jgi:hypothetical protein